MGSLAKSLTKTFMKATMLGWLSKPLVKAAGSAIGMSDKGDVKKAQMQGAMYGAMSEQQRATAAKQAEDEKRRKQIFFTSGQELGEDIGVTGNIERRGSILGN